MTIYLQRRSSPLLVLLLLILMCLQCEESQSTNQDTVSPIAFSTPRQICLPLDSLSPPTVPYVQILRGDTLKYLFYNQFNNSLYIYDFKKEKLINRIPVNFEGSVLPQFNAFFYINPDSILLFPDYGDFYYICDESGKIYTEKIPFVDDDDQNKIESHWINNFFPAIKIGNKIYINNIRGVAPQGDPANFLLIEHDLQNGSSEFFIQHPPSVNGKNFDISPLAHPGFTLRETDQKLLYSFNFDPYIYEYGGDKDEVSAHYAAPISYEIPQALKKEMSSKEVWTQYQVEPSFSKLTHDPFKNILIRVALKPYRLEDIKEGNINPMSPKKPLLYLFDNNYQLLGKILLNDTVDYNFSNLFATEEGLWIHKLIENEDLICFELINYEI